LHKYLHCHVRRVRTCPAEGVGPDSRILAQNPYGIGIGRVRASAESGPDA